MTTFPGVLVAAGLLLLTVAAVTSYRRARTRMAYGSTAASPDDCPPPVREVVAACRALRARTGGAFDAQAAARMPEVCARPGGGDAPHAVEPAGYVEGCVERAWRRLARAGAVNGMIDAAGDLLVRGRPAPDRRWRVGSSIPPEGRRPRSSRCETSPWRRPAPVPAAGTSSTRARAGRPLPCGP